jgi:hypothetical protein
MASVRKLEKLKQQLRDIQRELRALSVFRQNRQLAKFKRQLLGEYSYVKRQMTLIQESKKTKEREHREMIVRANKNRSEKMKRTWRYMKNIQENYQPDKSLREIRSMFSKQKKGVDTEIPEVAWRNPSP